MAALAVASLGRRPPLTSPSLALSTVDDHVSTLIGVDILEIHVSFGLGARHNEEQVCHRRLCSIPVRSTQEMEPPTTPNARRDAMGPRRLAEKLAIRRLRDRGAERRTGHAHRSRDGG